MGSLPTNVKTREKTLAHTREGPLGRDEACWLHRSSPKQGWGSEKRLRSDLSVPSCPHISISNSHFSFFLTLQVSVSISLLPTRVSLILPTCSPVPLIYTSTIELDCLVSHVGRHGLLCLQLGNPWDLGSSLHRVPQPAQSPTGHPAHGRHLPPKTYVLNRWRKPLLNSIAGEAK